MEATAHNADPKTFFLALMTFIFASAGHVIQELHTSGALHYILVTAQGLMYLASAGVGFITIWRFIKHRKNEKGN